MMQCDFTRFDDTNLVRMLLYYTVLRADIHVSNIEEFNCDYIDYYAPTVDTPMNTVICTTFVWSIAYLRDEQMVDVQQGDTFLGGSLIRVKNKKRLQALLVECELKRNG